MVDDWQTMTVADLGRVVTGKTPPTAKPQLYGEGYPFITPTDIGNFRYCEAARQVSEEGRESQRNLLLPVNTVCVTCIASVGKMCMTDRPSFTNQQINSVIADETRHDPFFVYYLLQTRIEYLKAIAGGSATPIINKTAFSEIEVSVPPLPVQRRIAAILSAYDDLIENNRRRMALLEESARLLYQEWFVRLRFPGHEHVRIKNGIPEGWTRESLREIAKVNRANMGRSFDGKIDYIDIASVTPGQINETTHYDFKEAPSRARRIVQHGDVIWSCVRPNRKSHAVIWRPSPYLIASTGFAVITPIRVPTSYLLHATTTTDFVGYLENHAKGAAYPAVVADDFERALILVPSKAILDVFNDFAEPLFEQCYFLRQQNLKLRTARDLLLPRLMSGEVIV